jgi:hypothetical protein
MFLIFINQCVAQDCIVAVDALKGKYEGECKNNKAEGKGRATGIDVYEGYFKTGLPHGQGKYTWANKSWFEGSWNKGAREGFGTMLYRLSQKDSVVTGFWKKNLYTGAYDKPYIISKRTKYVTGISVRKQNGPNTIVLIIESGTGGIVTTFGSAGPNAKPELTGLNIQTGNFLRKTETDISAKKMQYIFYDVEFPFKANYIFENDELELEILEPGKWLVEIQLHQ